MIKPLLIFTLIFAQVCTRNVRYLLQFANASFYNCTKQNGEEKIIVYFNTNPAKLEQSVENLFAAKNSGLIVEPWVSFCRNKTGQTLAQEFIDVVGTGVVDKIWMTPYDDKAGYCPWSTHSPQQNCQFIIDLIQAFKTKGISVNIATSRQSWDITFHHMVTCSQISHTLLWWIPVYDQQNFQPDFNLYKQIGGWTIPNMKLYNEGMSCGKKYGINYYV